MQLYLDMHFFCIYRRKTRKFFCKVDKKLRVQQAKYRTKINI